MFSAFKCSQDLLTLRYSTQQISRLSLCKNLFNQSNSLSTQLLEALDLHQISILFYWSWQKLSVNNDSYTGASFSTLDLCENREHTLIFLSLQS